MGTIFLVYIYDSQLNRPESVSLASLARQLLRASERSERSEHIVVVSSRFYYIYIYSVTKILRKIRATTFTERLRKITREGPGAPGMSNAASN